MSEERTERLAISLVDFDRVDPRIRSKIASKLDLSEILKLGTDRKEPTPCVAFKCPLLEAATICDILRSHDRAAGDNPTTLYIIRTAWTRIPNNVVLTITLQGKVHLNPQVFPVELPKAEYVPPERKIFSTGQSLLKRKAQQ